MGKKESQVRDGVIEHVDAVERSVGQLDEAVRTYLDDGEAFEDQARAVHDIESEADRIRKRTERVLFEGAFLPTHREDYFLLLERLDEVADKAEDVANHVVLTRPEVPDELRGAVEGILDNMVEMQALLGRTVRTLFEDTSKVEDLVAEMKSFEEAVDEAEFDLVRRVFEREGETAEKILVKDMVEMLARITDMIEDVGDHAAIVVVKRRA